MNYNIFLSVSHTRKVFPNGLILPKCYSYLLFIAASKHQIGNLDGLNIETKFYLTFVDISMNKIRSPFYIICNICYPNYVFFIAV